MFNLAVTGIASGVAYAAIGLCLVLTYQISGLINVSQGIVAGVGAFTTASVYDHDVSLAYVCRVVPNRDPDAKRGEPIRDR